MSVYMYVPLYVNMDRVYEYITAYECVCLLECGFVYACIFVANRDRLCVNVCVGVHMSV